MMATRPRSSAFAPACSWAPAAARLMRTKLEEMKDIHLYETVVSLRGALNQTSEAQMDALVAELCAE